MNEPVKGESEDLSKKERKALRTKKIILEAAKELFSEKGFDFVTMEEIADLAALSRATLYNYFNTKEEIYFSIGISKLEHWIEQYKLLDASKFTGEKLILYLTENLVKDILEFPLYSKLLRRFFYRSKELELPVQDLFYNSMVKRKEFQSSPEYKPQFKIFLELLEQYINYRQLWQKAINIGVKDGSIASTSNPIHLNFFLIMIIFGLLDQIDFRRYLMSMVNISNEQITGFILRLTNKFLTGEI
ncbi:MAG: TetR/AcrR family transcriptional regulator [Candidatus Hermodarchaeota archaeon]